MVTASTVYSNRTETATTQSITSAVKVTNSPRAEGNSPFYDEDDDDDDDDDDDCPFVI